MESESYFPLTEWTSGPLGILSLDSRRSNTASVHPKDLKEIVGKDELVRSKLLEELNSLFLLAGDPGLSTAYNWNSSDQIFPSFFS